MNPIKIQLWMVWITLFSATFSYRFFLGTESPKEEPLDITLATISFLLIGAHSYNKATKPVL